MESTKQIRSIRGQKSKLSLPFREGPGVGFSPREARLTLKIGVSSVSGVSGVSFRFWTKKSPIFGPNRNKTGVSSVSAVPSVPHQRGPLTKREARLTHKKGVSGFQVQDMHNASCFTNMTWIGLNLSGWNVTRLFHFKVF